MSSEFPPPFVPTASTSFSRAAELSYDNQRTGSALVHLIGVIGGWPAALWVYLSVRNRGGHLRQHAATELNMALTFAIGLIVAVPLTLIPILGVLVAIVTFFAAIARVIVSIVAAKRGHDGLFYRIPGSIPFAK